MLRQSSVKAVLGLAQAMQAGLMEQGAKQAAGALTQAQQLRFIGGDKIPEYWGKPSQYTEGTAFLGTPKNHLEFLDKRPLSPDVLDINGFSRHYAFPWAALSSITNRVTGCILGTGTIAVAGLALKTDVAPIVQYLASMHPVVLFPLKFAVCYTIFFHYMGGLRHIVWDHHTIGNQADKSSLLELDKADMSSKALYAASAVMSLICAAL